MGQHTTLKREIGLLSLIAYYFSTIVGAGIFIVPIITIGKAGPAAIISWSIALLSTIPFALVFAHISSRYKISGCIQKFLEESGGIKFGRSIALYLTITVIIGNALLSITASNFIIQALGSDFSQIMDGYALVFIVSIGAILLPTLFNLFEVGVSSKIQTISVIVLVVLVEVVVVVSLPHAKLTNIVPFAPHGYDAIYAAAILCFYSVIGWENVDAMAGEVKDPNVNYKKGIKYAIVMIGVFYLSIVVTTILVLDVANIDASVSIVTLLLSVAFSEDISRFATIFSVILILLGLNAWVLGSSRLIFALARDSVIPKYFSHLNAKSIPRNAIVLQGVICLSISFIIMLFRLDIDYILELASLAYLLLYTLIFFCGVKSFTTRKLKLLSLAAMLITAFFINESNNEVMSVVTSLLLCCFVYVYFIVGKRFSVKVVEEN